MTPFLASLLGTTLALVGAFALVAWALNKQKLAASDGEPPIIAKLSLQCSKCKHTVAYLRSEPLTVASDPIPGDGSERTVRDDVRARGAAVDEVLARDRHGEPIAWDDGEPIDAGPVILRCTTRGCRGERQAGSTRCWHHEGDTALEDEV
ncbi:MAG: hypothetical protein V4750_02615 [Pseudomonadota bacterium]